MDFLLALIILSAALAAAYFLGISRERKKQAERERNAAKDEAQKWADADTVSTPDRLRGHAKRKRDS